VFSPERSFTENEEKGWISIALRGQLYPNLGTFALLEKLGNSMDEGKIVNEA
jgi:hypothetical protein